MRKHSRGGKRMGGTGGGNPPGVVETREMLTEINYPDKPVKQALDAFIFAQDHYGYEADNILIAKMKGADAVSTMAYWDYGNNIAFNENYFDSKKMEAAYKRCEANGFHPPRGSKTPTQAIAGHEVGHGLTAQAAKNMGLPITDLHKAAATIVKEAKKMTKHSNVYDLASSISGYAKQNYAETVAEAYCDVYCNGAKARHESQAVVLTLVKYLKKGS